jgi:hypothetical protein
MPAISALGRMRQEDHNVEVRLDYMGQSVSKQNKKILLL